VPVAAGVYAQPSVVPEVVHVAPDTELYVPPEVVEERSAYVIVPLPVPVTDDMEALTVSTWPRSIGVVTVGVPGVPSAVLTVAAEDGPEVVVTGVDALSVAVTL